LVLDWFVITRYILQEIFEMSGDMVLQVNVVGLLVANAENVDST